MASWGSPALPTTGRVEDEFAGLAGKHGLHGLLSLQGIREDCGRVWPEQDAAKAKTETDEQK